MNSKIVTERGAHLDIRLPSISHALARSPRKLRSANKPPPPTTVQPVPPEKRPSEYEMKTYADENLHYIYESSSYTLFLVPEKNKTE